MAKFLVFSPKGDCWNLVPLLQKEGHEAVLYVHSEKARPYVAEGLVDKVDDYLEVLKDDRHREWIIVADSIGCGRILDELKRLGWRVWGGCAWADKFEKDREYAAKVFLSCGIPIPPSYVARSIDEAINFIRQNPKRYVLKPHENKLFTYIADGVEDALECLEYWKDTADNDMEITIQQYIKGRNVDVELWFGNGLAMFPANYTVETKKFMVDDLGASVGCGSSVVWASRRIARTVKEGVLPLEKITKRYGYTGFISVNLMISDRSNRIYALEPTPRLGYNAFYCQIELLPEGFGNLVLRMLNYNEDMRQFNPFIPIDTTKFACAARVSMPPYPLELADEKLSEKVYETARGIPVKLEGSYPAKVYAIDVMKDEQGRLVCAGLDAIIAEVVAADEDPVEAWRKVVRTVKMLKIPNKQARLRDGIEDFLKYYNRWVEYNLVGAVDDVERIPAPEGLVQEQQEGEVTLQEAPSA